MSEAVAPAPGKGSRSGGGLSLRRKRALIPLLFVLPGLAWLVLFYVIPIVSQVWVSTQTGNPDDGFVQTWNFAVYPEAVSEYLPQLGRSFLYAGIATLACLIISFPLAYFIAFKAGRWRNLMLLLVILPFFTSLIVRVVAWQTLLADDSFVVDAPKTIEYPAALDRATLPAELLNATVPVSWLFAFVAVIAPAPPEIETAPPRASCVRPPVCTNPAPTSVRAPVPIVDVASDKEPVVERLT